LPREKGDSDITSTVHCRNCGSTRLTRHYEQAELICEDCGLVIEDSIIDQGPEWRTFDGDSPGKRSRAGAPSSVMLHDKGLSTEIGWKNKDTYGKAIPTRNRAQLYRLRKWQRRIRVSNATERNLALALGVMDHLSGAMELPKNVRDTAAIIYRRAVNRNLVRGRSIEGVVAASIYSACRQCNVPRTLDEVAEKSNVGRKEIGRIYRFIARELSIRLLPAHPEDYILRFSQELKLRSETQAKANEVLKEATKLELTSGRGPTGVAAAAIYIASQLTGEKKTQREVANVAGVTEVTIRNRYKEFTRRLNLPVMV
jgi:transcription initiation factor TFIIB